MVQDALHKENGKEDRFQDHWKEEGLSARLQGCYKSHNMPAALQLWFCYFMTVAQAILQKQLCFPCQRLVHIINFSFIHLPAEGLRTSYKGTKRKEKKKKRKQLKQDLGAKNKTAVQKPYRHLNLQVFRTCQSPLQIWQFLIHLQFCYSPTPLLICPLAPSVLDSPLQSFTRREGCPTARLRVS